MKKLLFTILLLCPLSAFPENWISMHTKDAFFIDGQSFKYDEAWIKQKLNKPKIQNKQVEFVLINYSFSCQKMKLSVRKTIFYDKSGNMISQQNSTGAMETPIPNTMSEQHLSAMCTFDIVARRIADEAIQPINMSEERIEEYYKMIQKYIPELHSLMNDMRFFNFVKNKKVDNGNGISLIADMIKHRDIEKIPAVREIIDEYNKIY